MTGSIEAALEETNRRREKQIKYNTEHGITPKTIKKSIASSLKEMTEGDFIKDDSKEVEDLKNIDKKLKEYNRKMKEAAQNLEFEEAMVYRDKIKELELLAMKNLWQKNFPTQLNLDNWQKLDIIESKFSIFITLKIIKKWKSLISLRQN